MAEGEVGNICSPCENEEDEDENTDDDEDLRNGTSGDMTVRRYDRYEDEEDFDDNDDENVRPCSPVTQQFPPENIWRQMYYPRFADIPAGVPVIGPVVVPQQLIVRCPQVPHEELPDQQLD